MNKIKIDEIDISKLKRVSRKGTYEIVEMLVPGSRAFTLGRDGYFIIAPEQSLLPRFVIELQLPILGDFDFYHPLSVLLNELSSGFMWYRTGDLHAHDFVWRLRLSVKPANPLFEWTSSSKKKADYTESNASFRVAKKRDLDDIQAVNAQLPPEGGHLQDDDLKAALSKKHLFVAIVDDSITGYARTVPINKTYTSANPIYVQPGMGEPADIAKDFMRYLGTDLLRNGKTMLVSMSSNNPMAFKNAVALDMSLASQSFTAQIDRF